MPNLYFISDTHFYHKNIITYSQRPFSSVEEMNQKLIDNWNYVVKPNDIVYHLGDFAFCHYLQFVSLLKQLNGNINIVLGNHDKMIIKKQVHLVTAKLVNTINNYFELNILNKKFILFHFPLRSWNKKHHNSYHLYGHVHGNMDSQLYGKSMDVGVDSKLITQEYRPLHIEEIITYLDTQVDINIDHHNIRK